MLSGRRLSRIQQYAAELLLVLDARDQYEAQQERLRLALISHEPAKWLPVFFPETYAKVEREEVSDEDLDDDEGITYEFEDFNPTEAQDLLSMAMSQASEGHITEPEVNADAGGWR